MNFIRIFGEVDMHDTCLRKMVKKEKIILSYVLDLVRCEEAEHKFFKIERQTHALVSIMFYWANSKKELQKVLYNPISPLIS